VVAAVADTKPPILLFPRQMRFVRDTRPYPAYIGGIGSGKSFAGAAKVIARLSRKELGMIAAPTYPMLRDATRRTLTDMLETFGIEYELHKTENVITINRTGHEILCRSLDNPDTLRGPNLAYAWVDEGALIDREGWRVVKGRVRDGDNPQAWITSTPKGRNYLWEEWERDGTGNELDPTHPLYRVRTTENYHLPDGWAEGLGYTDEFYHQEIGGEFVAFEGLIYPGFRREAVRHIDTDGWRTLLGVDIGARNPTAVLTIRVNGDGHTHIERERYQRNLDSDEITDAIITEMATSGAEVAYADPSAKAYIDSWQKRALKVKPANNDVTRGIGIVKSALADGLTVDPSCVNTIAEFESYHWSDGDKDQPVKQNDHCLIAGTMVRTEHGERPIETISAGERVWTREGLQPVIAAGLTEHDTQVYTLRTTDGSAITGSSHHPIWADNRGWAFLHELRYGDILHTWNQRPLSSTESRSDATRILPAGWIGFTSRRTADTARRVLAACMRKSGSIGTGRSQLASRFIISTSIHSTTTYQTSTVCQPNDTRNYTGSETQNVHNRRNIASTSTVSGHSQRIGTHPTKVGNGTANTASKHGRLANLLSATAIIAALALHRSVAATVIGSARTSARAHGGAPQDWTTKSGHVWRAVKCSRRTSTAIPAAVPASVLSVTAEAQPQAVYNLTVSNVPEFYANGILVHNSMDALRYALVGEAAPKLEVRVL
jgi:PBSX family phage terminase large subunit